MRLAKKKHYAYKKESNHNHISNIYRSAANQLNGLIKPKTYLNFSAKRI